MKHKIRIITFQVLAAVAWVLHTVTIPFFAIGLGAYELREYLKAQVWESQRRAKKYVVLEHMQGNNKGKRFWSTNSDNNTRLTTGERVYYEILFTDNEQEAISYCQK